MIQRITACREITVYTSSPGTEAGASCCAAGAHPAAESSIQRGLHGSATAAPAGLCSHGSGSGREGHSPQTCPEPGVLCPLGCFPSVTPVCSHVSVSAELSHRCCHPRRIKFLSCLMQGLLLQTAQREDFFSTAELPQSLFSTVPWHLVAARAGAMSQQHRGFPVHIWVVVYRHLLSTPHTGFLQVPHSHAKGSLIFHWDVTGVNFTLRS